MASQNQEVLRRLKSTSYLDNIGLLFKSLYSNDNLADVTISCRDGPTIEAHKIVLSACSSYFHELLSKKTSHPVFIMHKISYQDMLYLLEFMYKGVIDVPEDSVDHLIKVAKELEITDFCLSENVQQTSQITKNSKSIHMESSPTIVFDNKKKNEIITIPEMDIASNDDTFSNIRKSTSERSSSDVNETQTSTLSRNTRFKGKKRVPVCETIDTIDNMDVNPRSLLKKKMSKSNSFQHSTPIKSKNDSVSNFVIKDISGANGAITYSYKNNGKDAAEYVAKGHNPTSTSSPPPLLFKSQLETPTEFAVGALAEDIIDIETVTPDITIENENNPISLEDSITETNSQFESKSNKAGITKQARPAKFRCEFCRKRFYRESLLHKHRKTHAGGSMRILFPCKKCNEKFTRFDKLKTHIKTYHDDDDYIPKAEKKKRLYGNPIEASPTELQQIEHNNNPTSVTQSIIQSINSITSALKNDNDETSANNTNLNTGGMFSGKRGRGRPPKEKTLIVKPRRPKGRPRKYFNMIKQERKPVGRPRNPDTPMKIKVLGRKPGRPRKSEQSIIEENQSKASMSLKSSDNYDGASLPYGDLSYLTTGLINHVSESSSSTNMYDNPIAHDPLASTSISSSSPNEPLTDTKMMIDTKSDPPPILTANTDIMTFIPPIKSECNTTITPIVTSPPTLEPIIPFQNENITITQIPPLIYLKTPTSNTSSTSSSTVETNGAINMKKIGDCTIQPIT